MDWRPSFGSRSDRFILYLLFFSSGVGALVFQVLWHRRLTLLLGNTAQAAAMTVAVFFLGLVIGGRYWGLRASHVTNPLRTYGLLEIGVALGGLFVLVLQDMYGFVYAAVFGNEIGRAHV